GFAPGGRLIMYAFCGGHEVHLPFPAKPIAEIQILTRRTASEERRKPADGLECFTPQRTHASANPLAGNKLTRVCWKSIGQSRSDQFPRLKAFNPTMQNYAVDSPK